MENKKNNKGVIILLIAIIIILSVLCVLFATGTISFNSNDVDNNEPNSNVNDKVEEGQIEEDIVDTTLTEDDAMNIVKSVMKRSFNYIYGLSPECGDRNINDKFQENDRTYEASTSYNTQVDLKEYLHTFLSDALIKSVEEKYVVDMYKEKDNKLYCLNTGKDCEWVYNDSDTNYTIGHITNNEINAGGNIFYYETCGNEKKVIPVSFVLKKDNYNNWILDTFLTK